MRTIATVGVYDSSLDDVLEKLRRHRVAMVVDVRQRRGVRGREHAWANPLRLQAVLQKAGIGTRTSPNWRPPRSCASFNTERTTLKVGKRSRVELAEEYRRRYLHEVLDQVELGAFLDSLPDEATSALLCVDCEARACHRSLIAARLHDRYGVPVVNL